MSAETETNAQPTTSEPDNSPESWAEASNEVADAAPASSETASGEETASQEAGEQAEGEAAADDADADPPPEFWSAERKEQWKKIQDPEIRAAIRDHYEEATRSTNKKIEEAALKARQAEEQAKTYQANQEQLAAWWNTTGPQLVGAFQNKWAGVDWNKLSAENPAEYVRLTQQRDSEAGMLRDAQTRHQAEMKAVETRREQAHQQERAAEHAKLAKSHPAEFSGDKAQETYNTLSKYLLDQGIAPDRLKGIYEEAVVSTVLKAYKYDQLRAKAKGVTDPASSPQNAAKTPTRVAPGPGQSRTGNQGSEAERQAIQALKSGERLTAEQAALAFR